MEFLIHVGCCHSIVENQKWVVEVTAKSKSDNKYGFRAACFLKRQKKKILIKLIFSEIISVLQLVNHSV